MGRTVLFSLALFLCGCATPYQNMGFTGGVDELQVSDLMYRITARGNGYLALKGCKTLCCCGHPR